MSRLNEQLIYILEILHATISKTGDNFRAKNYENALNNMVNFQHDINDLNDLKNVPKIGTTIFKKLKEYIETKKIQSLEELKNKPEMLFLDIYGIGPKKAEDLVKSGYTTISDLRNAPVDLLNDKQKLGLKYYEDILKKIPRDEIDAFKEKISSVINNRAKFEIVGSYRRGKQQSGDIDVIITHEDNDSTVFDKILDDLEKEKMITHFLSRGKSKSLVIGQLDETRPFRRVDFLYASPNEYPFSILYFTGSKYFNTAMRGYSLKLGYSLNEHAFKDIKTQTILQKEFKTEKDIFEFLNIKYVEPHERINLHSIKIEDSNPIYDNEVMFVPKIKKKNKTLKVVKVLPEDCIKLFQQNGIDQLKKLREKDLNRMIKCANDYYYNKQPIMSDNEYDILKEYIEKTFPDNDTIKLIGSEVKKNKVLLPYPMPSLDKIKPDTNSLSEWKEKFKERYVLSCKCDGVSGMLTNEDGELKLFTRGDGKVGQNITHMIPYLNLDISKDFKFTIRCELIMKKNTFDKKYKDKFANPRNLVSGIVNQLKIDAEKYGDLDMIVYEVMYPTLKPSEQIQFINKLNLNCVKNVITSELTNEYLSELLLEWRDNYDYEIDGVVVSHDDIYEREYKNPESAFAFKMLLSEQAAEAKVLDVIWTPSKDGYLKPRVKIEPINLGGVTIEYATGFNGQFIQTNKIGVGSIVQIVRSGDVIPHILSVLTPATVAKMPEEDYVWTDTKVDIILQNVNENTIVQEKNITGFFKGIGVDGLSIGNVKRIMNGGFDTVPKILAMTKLDYLSIDGFKEKMANKIYTNIKQQISVIELPKLMVATNLFGRGMGEKRIELILSEYPDILTSNENIVPKLVNIKGMANKTAELFASKINEFKIFIDTANLNEKLTYQVKKQVVSDHPLSGKTIMFTGFRDATLVNYLNSIGVKIGSSVTKTTDLLILKNKDVDSGKKDDAIKYNIEITTIGDFKDKYNI